MKSRAVTLRVPEDVRNAIDDAAERTGRSFASVANELLAEAIKTRRVPGIVFADGVVGRVPRVAGTGLEVFEIVGGYRRMDEDWVLLRRAYHWLTEAQLRAALDYAASYP